MLTNGATIAGFNVTMDQADNITIDWNGAEGPNTVGEDQLQILLLNARAGFGGNCTSEISAHANRTFKMIPGECTGSGFGEPAGNTELFESIWD